MNIARPLFIPSALSATPVRPEDILHAGLVVGLLILALVASSVARQRQHRRQARQAELEESEAKLRLALWGSGEWLWELDAGWQVHLPAGLLQHLGFGPDPVSQPLVESLRFIRPADRQSVKALLSGYDFKSVRSIDLTLRVACGPLVESRLRWIRWRARTVLLRDRERLQGDRRYRFVGTCKDVTEEMLRLERYTRAAQVMEGTHDAVAILDSRMCVKQINRNFTRITGFHARDVVNKPMNVLCLDPDNSQFCRKIGKRVRSEGAWEGEAWRCRKGGEQFLAHMHVVLSPSMFDRSPDIVMMFSDITEQRASEERLRFLASFDPLTGLLNRACFLERLGTMMAADRTASFAVFFIDLDYFKKINDSFGHSIGDRLIRETAQRLATVVDSNEPLARLGGDEFALAVKLGLGSVDSQGIAEQVLALLDKEFLVDDLAIKISASIGIRKVAGEDVDALHILEQADIAMYRAKGAGRCRAVQYDPGMLVGTRERLALESDLRHAVERDEFRLHYQPIVIAGSGEVRGFEALLRWQHPTSGLLSPDSFVSHAEETGQMEAIGLWVLERACRDIVSLNARYGRSFHISINVSADQVRAPGFIWELRDILDASGLDARLLRIEITETLLLDSQPMVIKNLAELRKLGVEIALDDFGTGYSSLSYLCRFPVGCIKVDRFFVHEMDQPQARSVIHAIVAMARSMDMVIVAEGVEIERHQRQLEDIGCDELQGFLFGRAVPLEEIDQFMLNRSVHARRSITSLKH